MTKAQGRRSNKNKGRYADRFNITKRNKERRAKNRAKKANSKAAADRRARRLAAWIGRYPDAAIKKGLLSPHHA